MTGKKLKQKRSTSFQRDLERELKRTEQRKRGGQLFVLIQPGDIKINIKDISGT